MKSPATCARLLIATSPKIERQPLIRRPRFMAATWGGLLVCKTATVFIVGATVGLPLLALVAIGGGGAVAWRFRHGEPPLNQQPSRAFAAPATSVS